MGVHGAGHARPQPKWVDPRFTGLVPLTHQKGRRMPLLWIIVLILVILAIGGGVAVSNLLWLLLVVALIVAVFALLSGRRGAL